VISSSAERTKDIEALGARSAVGSVEDVSFLTKSFTGADAVYLMIPPSYTFTGSWLDYQKRVTTNYVTAINNAKVKHAALLSSVGAHMGKGSGPVDGLAFAEWHLSQIKDLNLKIYRPSYFYMNLMGQISLVKNMNIFGANYGGTSEKLVLTHTDDIADVIAKDLQSLKFKGKTIQYIASDECYPKEIAEVLGKAVGKAGIPWVEFKDEDAKNGMIQGGVKPELAKGFVELGIALRNGKAQQDYWKNKPKLGKIKLKDFAKEFVAAYNS
jgi:nucleoside-diphosphate-sugar epimerase